MAESTTIPSVKGSIFQLAITGLRALIDSGLIPPEAVEAGLEAEDIRYVEEKLLMGGWYPIDAFDRIARFALGYIDLDQTQYLADQGSLAADTLLSSESYSSFKNEIETRGERSSTAMIMLVRLIFNFGDWRLEQEDLGENGKFRVVATRMDAMPELLLHSTRGFITRLSSMVTGVPMEVESRRPTRDELIFDGKPA